MSGDAWAVILDSTELESSLAEHYTTKSWALGLTVHTSKSELPCGFKRLQLPCYKPREHPTSLLWAGAAKYPHLRDGAGAAHDSSVGGQ